MPMYTFICGSKRHEEDETRKFVATIHTVKDKRVDQIQCPDCGGLAKRDFAGDIATVNTLGATPISLATTGKGSLHNTVEFAFGKFKKNPDGTEDRNHARFDTIKDLDRYANGANDLGPPKLDPRTGQPMRRPDGSMIRTGAKLIKFDKHRRPPVNKRPPVNVPDAWVGGDTIDKAGPTREISLRDAGVSPTRYRSPERRRG